MTLIVADEDSSTNVDLGAIVGVALAVFVEG